MIVLVLVLVVVAVQILEPGPGRAADGTELLPTGPIRPAV